MLQSYWLSLRLIAGDVFRLYQNFWHWNLSKLTILFVTFLIALVISTPFLGAIWFMVSGMVNGLGAESLQDLLISGTLSEDMINALLDNYWLMGAILFCIVSAFAILTSMMTYGYYLTSRVYQSYIEGTRLGVLKNDYFSIPHIWKFLGILGWSSLYLMIPIAYGFVGLGVLMFLTTGTGIIASKFVTGIIVGILAIIFFSYFVIIAIRVMFSYMMMLETDALQTSARDLVRRSIRLSQGNIPRIIALFLPFAIGVAFCGVVFQTIQEYRDVSVITAAANAAVMENPNAYINDHAFVQNQYLELSRLSESEKQDVLSINNAFDVKTDGIDPEYLKSVYPYIVISGTLSGTMDIVWQVGLGLLSFFLLNGLMLMVYLSIYHILKATVTESENPKGKPDTEPTTDLAKTLIKKATVKIPSEPSGADSKNDGKTTKKTVAKKKSPVKKSPVTK